MRLPSPAAELQALVHALDLSIFLLKEFNATAAGREAVGPHNKEIYLPGKQLFDAVATPAFRRGEVF